MFRTACVTVFLITCALTGHAQGQGNLQGGSIVSTAPTEVVKDFAPTGKLRAAINLGNIGACAEGPGRRRAARHHSGPRPRAWTAARPAGRVRPLSMPRAKCSTALKSSGAWDIAFLAIEPVRAAEIAFTAPYVIIEGVYMVPNRFAPARGRRVDRDGVRIAVNKGSAYDLFLTRTLKHAQLVRARQCGIDLFIKDKLDAAAGVKQPLVAFAKTESGRAADRRPLHGDSTGDGHAQAALPGA